MHCVGFEPTIPASERAKTVHALDRSPAVTGEACACIAEKFLHDKIKYCLSDLTFK
jgi:FAD synthase